MADEWEPPAWLAPIGSFAAMPHDLELPAAQSTAAQAAQSVAAQSAAAQSAAAQDTKAQAAQMSTMARMTFERRMLLSHCSMLLRWTRNMRARREYDDAQMKEACDSILSAYVTLLHMVHLGEPVAGSLLPDAERAPRRPKKALSGALAFVAPSADRSPQSRRSPRLSARAAAFAPQGAAPASQ